MEERPAGGARTAPEKAGYAPLRSKAQDGSSQIVLKLDDRGLSEVLEEVPDLTGSVEDAIEKAKSNSRSSRVAGTAEVLAVWEIPLPANLPAGDALAFCRLAYRFVVRSAGISWELCGTAGADSLKVWFVPLAEAARGEAALSARGLMTRGEYLDLYAALRDYLEEELGYAVDVDADDVMYREMGFTEQERREAIEERDGMAKAAGDLGDKLREEAQGFAKGFVKSFRKGILK